MRSLATFVLSLWILTAWASEDIQPEAYTGLSELKAGEATTAMVVAAHPLATQAGINILAKGGSAVDAAITVQLVLTLVEPQSSGIGGGAFMLHYASEGEKLQMFDGRETAPQQITAEHFLEADGSPQSFWKALVGGHSVGVPGVLAMLELAHKEHGKLPWEALFVEPIALARNGFPVSPRLHLLLTRTKHLAVNPQISSYFFDKNAKPWPIGHILKNPEYAQTLELLAAKGVKAFYQGKLAKSIANAVANDPNNPGLLTEQDLANYTPKVRKASCKEVYEHRICSAAPPSSGGITILQQLAILESLDEAYESPEDPIFLHHFAAASNLAFADRNHYLADPDFLVVPEDALLNGSYLTARAGLITDEALVKATAGSPKGAPERLTWKTPEQPSTSHFSIVDADGDVVSMTTSIEMGFGSRVMVGGFLLNNQLTDFNFVPRDASGHLVANSVAPEKRPRSSMSPTIVFNLDGTPKLVVGSPGGSRIINYTAQAIFNVLKFNLTPAQAAATPHITARNNGRLELEVPGFSGEVVDALSAKGYQVSTGAQTSGVHMILIDGERLVGGADPRREGTVGALN